MESTQPKEENAPEEEKQEELVQEDPSGKKQYQFSPQVLEAMAMCKISQDDPDFTYQKMCERFKQVSQDKSVHFQIRDNFEHLHKILGEHKFWHNQAIQKSFEYQKEGQIKEYKPEDISDEPTPLPPGFEW